MHFFHFVFNHIQHSHLFNYNIEGKKKIAEFLFVCANIWRFLQVVVEIIPKCVAHRLNAVRGRFIIFKRALSADWISIIAFRGRVLSSWSYCSDGFRCTPRRRRRNKNPRNGVIAGSPGARYLRLSKLLKLSGGARDYLHKAVVTYSSRKEGLIA